MKKFVCSVCGYVYEGEAAPAECPICHAPAEKFKEQAGEKTWAAEHVVGVAQGAPEDIMADLRANFEGECSEVGMYLAMARVAHREGYPEIGLYWEKAAFEEAEHAAKFAELLGEVVTDSTEKNLQMRVDAENGATAGKDGSVVVDEDAKTVLVSQIKAEQIPQGYTVESTGELKIQEIGGKEGVLVTLKKIATTKPVTVAFYDTANKAMLSTTMTINVASDAEFVYKTDLKESLPGYEIIDNGKNQISENNRVVMSVKPIAPEESMEVTVTYYMKGSNEVITKSTVTVPKSKKVLSKAELPAATVESNGYLFDVVAINNGPFGINDLGGGKGEVAVTATIKMHK